MLGSFGSFNAMATAPVVPAPVPVSITDVMREQLDYLIGHVEEQGICGCGVCQNFFSIRDKLLAIFKEPARLKKPDKSS